MPASVPLVVHELVDASNAVHDAAKNMKNCKDNARKISKMALEISTSVDHTATTAAQRGDALDANISMVAALGATKDVFEQCTTFMRSASEMGTFTRYLKKRLTVDTVGGYLAAVEGLHALLKVHDLKCELMLEPFTGLGIDENCSKGDLYAKIKTINADYDGLKSTCIVMVNITDGLPWPLRAAPQSFLHILQLFEECQDCRSKISALIYDVQNLWRSIERISRIAATAENLYLSHDISDFFEILQRIAIRLHVVLRMGQVQRRMAIQTILTCLVLEQGRLVEAQKNISLALREGLPASSSRPDTRGTTISPNNSNVNHINGPGTITNNNHVHVDMRPPAPRESDVSVSASLPPKPIVFHGRNDFVNDAVQLLTTSGAACIAVLGTGGMGKTTVALSLLYDSRIMDYFGVGRLFLSCEALVDVDILVVSLAKLLNLPASNDLLNAVVTHLTARSRVVLVLDNLETVWLVGGAPVDAVDELLGRLSQIPSLSLIITCRGIVLPQLVEWSNTDTAVLERFSLEAALETFQDRAGHRLSGKDEETAKQLLDAVDRMPLAVSLLGQLARRGNTVAELLERWNREHSALLQTHGAGRINNAEVSIEVSIKMLCAADESGESLQLLGLCSMLPDGLRPDVFEKLRPRFKRIDRARDNLTAYALASLGADRVLKTLSPIRHLVLERHPALPIHRDALHSIYFGIAERLPQGVDEHFKGLAAVAAPEMNNLSSILVTLVSQPSQQVVDAVIRFTHFAYRQQPTLTVASALLLHLDPHPIWKARCLLNISYTQMHIGDHRAAIDSLNTAKRLFLEVRDRSFAAWCTMHAADVHRLFGDYDRAEMALKEAQMTYAELGDEMTEAKCRLGLGVLMRQKHDYQAAIEHLSAARQTFSSLGEHYMALQCSKYLGTVYLDQGNLEPAGVELEVARAAFINFGEAHQTPQCSLALGMVRRKQGNLALAEQLLKEAAVQYNKSGEQLGLASCEKEFGYLRHNQGRLDEAITHFDSAWRLFKSLQMQKQADECYKWVEWLKSTAHTVDDSVQLALP